MFAWYDDYLDPIAQRVQAWVDRQARRIPPRLAVYIPPLVYLAWCLVEWGITPDDVDVSTWRTVAFAFLVFVSGVSGMVIRAHTDYHPAYAVEKRLETGAWLLLFCQAKFHLAADYEWFQFVWIGLLLIARTGSFEFILRRNEDASRRYIKTSAGLVPALNDRSKANLLWERAMGEARHGDVSPHVLAAAKVLLDDMEELRDYTWVRIQAERMREEREEQSIRVAKVGDESLGSDGTDGVG